MPLLTRQSTRDTQRRIYGGTGALETITMLVRGDDLNQGTVRAVKVFNCRHSVVSKTGEPIQGEMSSAHETVWHLPKVELDRAGVNHINAATRIVQKNGDTWQPESTTLIVTKLFGNEIDVNCLRLDPPA